MLFLHFTYFLIPTFYDKDLIQSQIKNQILKKYNINIKFNDEINYSLLPKPHFFTKNLSINREMKKKLEIVNHFKIFISIFGNFFSFNEIEIKDLNF